MYVCVYCHCFNEVCMDFLLAVQFRKMVVSKFEVSKILCYVCLSQLESKCGEKVR